MNTRTALAAALLLAGCAATTPKTLMEEGERSAHRVERAPEQAVLCMARNAESAYPFAGTTRPLDERGAYDLALRLMPDMTFAYAVAEPEAGGSRVTIWLRPAWFHRRDELIPSMLKGC
jgi:hypothetical protein